LFCFCGAKKGWSCRGEEKRAEGYGFNFYQKESRKIMKQQKRRGKTILGFGTYKAGFKGFGNVSGEKDERSYSGIGKIELGMVSLACDFSYSRGRGRKIASSRPA
jgi:hypothetical protein